MQHELPEAIRDLVPLSDFLQIKDILIKLMDVANLQNGQVELMSQESAHPGNKDSNILFISTLIKYGQSTSSCTFDCVASLHFDINDTIDDDVPEYLRRTVNYINAYLFNNRTFQGIKYEFIPPETPGDIAYRLKPTWQESFHDDRVALEKIHNLHNIVLFGRDDMMMIQVENETKEDREKGASFGNNQHRTAEYILLNIQMCWIVAQICARVRHNNSIQGGKN